MLGGSGRATTEVSTAVALLLRGADDTSDTLVDLAGHDPVRFSIELR